MLMTIMNKLKFAKAYLVGPMDRCRESGKTWRADISEWLIETLGIIPFDPYHKPLHPIHNQGLENDDSFMARRKAIAEGDWARARELMKPVVSADLRMVDHADFLIVYFDIEAAPCGTFDEIFMAADENKPVIMMCPHGIKKTYDWMFGRLRPEMFFETWDEVKAYLLHIAYDNDIDTLNKWKFFTIEDTILRIVRQEYELTPKSKTPSQLTPWGTRD